MTHTNKNLKSCYFMSKGISWLDTIMLCLQTWEGECKQYKIFIFDWAKSSQVYLHNLISLLNPVMHQDLMKTSFKHAECLFNMLSDPYRINQL